MNIASRAFPDKNMGAFWDTVGTASQHQEQKMSAIVSTSLQEPLPLVRMDLQLQFVKRCQKRSLFPAIFYMQIGCWLT